MKILKIALILIISILVIVTVGISFGTAVCKNAEFPGNILIQACGYLPYFLISLTAGVVVLLLLIIRKYRIALSYFSIMIVFTILLNDFSLRCLFQRIPQNSNSYHNLNVGAYNVWHYSLGIDKVVKYFRESDFDVVLLSESVLTPEQLEYFKSSLSSYSVLSDNGQDLSLLSKYPIVDYKIIEFPTNLAKLSGNNDLDQVKNNGIHRTFIHAVVNVKGTFVHILSLRLIAGRPKNNSLAENIRWGGYLLNSQYKELSSFLGYIQSLKGPLIFGGDLNVTPNTEIIRRLSQYAGDAYLEKHLYGACTFNSSFLKRRLDYIFHSKEIIVKKSKIVNAGLSDHFLVHAEFLIPKNEMQALK